MRSKRSCAGKEQHGVGRIHDGRTQQHADRVQVVGHASHDVAGAMVVVVRGRLFFELGEEVVAEIELDIARDTDNDPAHEEQQDAVGHGDGDQQAGVGEDLVPGDADGEVVDGDADDPGELHPDSVGEDGADTAPQIAAPVAAHIGKQGLEVFEHSVRLCWRPEQKICSGKAEEKVRGPGGQKRGQPADIAHGLKES